MQRWLAVGAIAAQVIFTAGWLGGAAVQRGDYSATRHYISDLASMTADHPWILLIAQGIAGVLTIAFALVALRRTLLVPGHRTPVSAWLVAASGLGLDNLSDAFFRLDCRAIDASCLASVPEPSWHAQIHGTVGTLTSLATLLAPFALAGRFTIAPAWRGWFGPALVFGAVIAVGVAASLMLDDFQGATQRFGRLIAALGVVLLAIHVHRLASRQPAQPTAVN